MTCWEHIVVPANDTVRNDYLFISWEGGPFSPTGIGTLNFP